MSCHQHFLKDIGKDLLTKAYDELRGLFREYGMSSSLRSLVREWGKKLGLKQKQAAMILKNGPKNLHAMYCRTEQLASQPFERKPNGSWISRRTMKISDSHSIARIWTFMSGVIKSGVHLTPICAACQVILRLFEVSDALRKLPTRL